jgi:serine/threonine protein phosphatase PrpC
MRVMNALSVAGATHPGHYREVNEDRYHADIERGFFLVVDGVGGQAAGGKAADTAVAIMRARLERETGPVRDRVREAIAAANNEINRLGFLRAEWAGMACVLTAALVHDETVVVGHVGDTRLYKLRNGRIEKVTRDHSPVGEREDAGELSELDAMRNPRRNEVYRDVGSEPHEPGDPDFIDLIEIPFEADAALLLCSDGLTDLVPSATMNRIVSELAGRPDEVVRALVAAANAAGGKDNVTVVYVEGEQFVPKRHRPLSAAFSTHAPVPRGTAAADSHSERVDEPGAAGRFQVLARRAFLMTLIVALVGAVAWSRPPRPPIDAAALTAGALAPGTVVVGPSGSIMAAMDRAVAGSDVLVEPGEYRERIRLKDGVRVISREPLGATIRLPSDASENEAAVVADGVSGAELTGFRIVGDAATPLGTGLSIRNASVRVVNLEIVGAAELAIDIAGVSGGTIVGSDIHDNPGVALRVGSGATPRIAHNSFIRNGTSARAATSVLIETGAHPRLSRNIFQGVAGAAFVTLDDAARRAVARENWFIEPPASREAVRRPGRNR